MNTKPFCPQCTAEWDRPWYDVCPSCGHRFVDRPWWQTPFFIVLLICLPACGLAVVGSLLRMVPSLQETQFGVVALILALAGVPVTSVAAGIILAVRMGRNGGAAVGWGLLWAVLFGVVAASLCFFSCLFGFA